MPDALRFDVIVAWAIPQHALLRPLQVAPGTTIEQAIAASGLLQEVPEIDLATCPVGIYGKKKPLDTVVHAVLAAEATDAVEPIEARDPATSAAESSSAVRVRID